MEADLQLEGLNEEEKAILLSVIKRDEELRKVQDNRVTQLRTEIHNLRMQSALREGDDLSKICARCHKPFGFFFNTGDTCSQCRFKVCSTCRESLLSGKWLCTLCYKQVQLKGLTGEWIYESNENENENDKRKSISGTDLVKASLGHGISNGKVASDHADPNTDTYQRQKDYGTGKHRGRERDGDGSPDKDTSKQASRERLDQVGYPGESEKRMLSSLVETAQPGHTESNEQYEIKRVSCRRRRDSDTDTDSGPDEETPMDVNDSKTQSPVQGSQSSPVIVAQGTSETESASDPQSEQKLQSKPEVPQDTSVIVDRKELSGNSGLTIDHHPQRSSGLRPSSGDFTQVSKGLLPGSGSSSQVKSRSRPASGEFVQLNKEYVPVSGDFIQVNNRSRPASAEFTQVTKGSKPDFIQVKSQSRPSSGDFTGRSSNRPVSGDYDKQYVSPEVSKFMQSEIVGKSGSKSRLPVRQQTLPAVSSTLSSQPAPDLKSNIIRRTSSGKSDSSFSSARTASPATKMRLLDLASKRALERESFEESGQEDMEEMKKLQPQTSSRGSSPRRRESGEGSPVSNSEVRCEELCGEVFSSNLPSNQLSMHPPPSNSNTALQFVHEHLPINSSSAFTSAQGDSDSITQHQEHVDKHDLSPVLCEQLAHILQDNMHVDGSSTMIHDSLTSGPLLTESQSLSLSKHCEVGESLEQSEQEWEQENKAAKCSNDSVSTLDRDSDKAVVPVPISQTCTPVFLTVSEIQGTSSHGQNDSDVNIQVANPELKSVDISFDIQSTSSKQHDGPDQRSGVPLDFDADGSTDHVESVCSEKTLETWEKHSQSPIPSTSSSGSDSNSYLPLMSVDLGVCHLVENDNAAQVVLHSHSRSAEHEDDVKACNEVRKLEVDDIIGSDVISLSNCTKTFAETSDSLILGDKMEIKPTDGNSLLEYESNQSLVTCTDSRSDLIAEHQQMFSADTSLMQFDPLVFRLDQNVSEEQGDGSMGFAPCIDLSFLDDYDPGLTHDQQYALCPAEVIDVDKEPAKRQYDNCGTSQDPHKQCHSDKVSGEVGERSEKFVSAAVFQFSPVDGFHSPEKHEVVEVDVAGTTDTLYLQNLPEDHNTIGEQLSSLGTIADYEQCQVAELHQIVGLPKMNDNVDQTCSGNVAVNDLGQTQQHLSEVGGALRETSSLSNELDDENKILYLGPAECLLEVENSASRATISTDNTVVGDTNQNRYFEHSECLFEAGNTAKSNSDDNTVASDSDQSYDLVNTQHLLSSDVVKSRDTNGRCSGATDDSNLMPSQNQQQLLDTSEDDGIQSRGNLSVVEWFEKHHADQSCGCLNPGGTSLSLISVSLTMTEGKDNSGDDDAQSDTPAKCLEINENPQAAYPPDSISSFDSQHDSDSMTSDSDVTISDLTSSSKYSNGSDPTISSLSSNSVSSVLTLEFPSQTELPDEYLTPPGDSMISLSPSPSGPATQGSPAEPGQQFLYSEVTDHGYSASACSPCSDGTKVDEYVMHISPDIKGPGPTEWNYLTRTRESLKAFFQDKPKTSESTSDQNQPKASESTNDQNQPITSKSTSDQNKHKTLKSTSDPNQHKTSKLTSDQNKSKTSKSTIDQDKAKHSESTNEFVNTGSVPILQSEEEPLHTHYHQKTQPVFVRSNSLRSRIQKYIEATEQPAKITKTEIDICTSDQTSESSEQSSAAATATTVSNLSQVGRRVSSDERDPFASEPVNVDEAIQRYLEQDEMSDCLSVITERTEPDADDISELSEGLEDNKENNELDKEIEKIYQANLHVESYSLESNFNLSGSASFRKSPKRLARNPGKDIHKTSPVDKAEDGKVTDNPTDVLDAALTSHEEENSIQDLDEHTEMGIIIKVDEDGATKSKLDQNGSISDEHDSACFDMSVSTDSMKGTLTPKYSDITASTDTLYADELRYNEDEEDNTNRLRNTSVDAEKEGMCPEARKTGVHKEYEQEFQTVHTANCKNASEKMEADDLNDLQNAESKVLNNSCESLNKPDIFEPDKTSNLQTTDLDILENVDVIVGDEVVTIPYEVNQNESYIKMEHAEEERKEANDGIPKSDTQSIRDNTLINQTDCDLTEACTISEHYSMASPSSLDASLSPLDTIPSHVTSPHDLHLQVPSTTLTPPPAESSVSQLPDLLENYPDVNPEVKVTGDLKSETESHGGDSGHISGTSADNTPEHKSPHSHLSIPSIANTSTSVEEQQHDEADDDIDGLVATHKNLNHYRGNLRNSFTDSRESLYSVYSDAGEINYGRIPVSGEILFGLDYNYKTGALEIHVKQCKDIAPVDTKRNKSDPYVKTYLLPDKTRSGKRKTKIKKHTLNPTFDEVLRYVTSKSEVENRVLWVTVWHQERFGHNDFLGEVMIPLDCYKFGDASPVWYPLQERLEAPGGATVAYKGDLLVSLKYVPAENIEVQENKKGKGKKVREPKGELQVLVKEAKNLTAVRANGSSDPFVKGYLLPEKHRSAKQKTAIVKRNCNPTWNDVFLFENLNWDDLKERSLELTIWDYDKLTSNQFLGGVRLNLGMGVAEGRRADWMDARGEEIAIWQCMIDRPNSWNDGTIGLRATMGKSEIRK